MRVPLLPTVPSAPPQEVRGAALDSRRLEVTWAPPPLPSQNGEIRGYRIRYQEPDNKATASAPVVTVPATQRSYVLQDLKKWTQYKLWVAAFTRKGDGPYSDVIIVQTDEDGT